MNFKLLRVYKNLNLDDIKEHLMICGDLSASCSKCSNMTIKTEMLQCPECNSEFRYITFRNPKDNMAKILKLSQNRPELVFVDFDDFKKATGALKAHDFFK